MNYFIRSANLFVLFAGILFSQTMQVNIKDGSSQSFKLSDIQNITFSLAENTTITDIDGNVYNTVKIGDQIWMAENLKVTHYRNGDAIPNVTGTSSWNNLTTGAYANYNNNISNGSIYGRLYNWYAVNDSRNIAPVGWHVPSDAEWKTLEVYLGMNRSAADALDYRGTNEGGKLKETGLMHWKSPNTGASNESGFSALPGGSRGESGEFIALTEVAIFWTTSLYTNNNPLYRYLSHGRSDMYRQWYYKRLGFSVRCIKD